MTRSCEAGGDGRSRRHQRSSCLEAGAWGLAASLLLCHATHADHPDSTSLGPVEVVELSATSEYRELVHGHRAAGGQLILTPDTCFFHPHGPRNVEESIDDSLPGAEFNNNRTWGAVANIQAVGQRIQWPVLPVNEGTWDAGVFLETPHSGVEVIVRLGDEEQHVTTVASDGTTAQPWNLSFNVQDAGTTAEAIRFFELELANLNGRPELGLLRRVVLESPQMDGDLLLRARWRPAAIHGGFRSSTLAATGLGIDLMVVEQVADYTLPIVANFYAPITTSFGYYGSPFRVVPDDPEGRFLVSAPNFSMWNYGMNADPPPVETFSHLLAVGSPLLDFGGFTHEGTGVKPRDAGGWPLAHTPVHSFVSALRHEPATTTDVNPFTRYTGSFWNPVEQRWQLYAIGNKSGIDTNFRLPSSFVEVAGPPARQRTGQVVRRMLYRGWVRDTEGSWHQLDSQTAGAGPGEIVNKTWAATADGWLVREMGGILHREYLQADQVITVEPPDIAPPFLKPDALAALSGPPMEIILDRVVHRSGEGIEASFTLSGNSHPVGIRLYHGTDDGLTLIFEDGSRPDEWEGYVFLGEYAAGTHTVSVQAPDIPASGFGRLLANSEEHGRFWSHQSAMWIEPVELEIAEGSVAGTHLGFVPLANPTAGRATTYQIASDESDGLLAIDSATGAVHLARDFVAADHDACHAAVVTAVHDGWSGRVPGALVHAILQPETTTPRVLFNFSPNQMEGEVVDVPDAQTHGLNAGNLIDHATGTGALSSGNQHPNNRTLVDGPPPHLRFSSRRESDEQTPVEPGGDNHSTWLTFHITPEDGHTADFSPATLTIDTFANSSLSGETSAHWTLYYRHDTTEHWTPLGTYKGASVTGTGFAGPVALEWELCEVGTTDGKVHFLIDPQTSSFGTNGTVGQRGVGIGNIRVDLNRELLAGFDAWAARHGLAGADPAARLHGGGLPLAMEFALGRDPHLPGGSPAMIENNSLSFAKGAEAVQAGVVFRIETSTDLGKNDPWKPLTPDVDDEHTIRATIPGTHTQSFYRLAVELP